MTEKRRAEDEMRRRNRELNALNAMAVVATQSFDLDEILNLTLRQVVSLFGDVYKRQIFWFGRRAGRCWPVRGWRAYTGPEWGFRLSLIHI